MKKLFKLNQIITFTLWIIFTFMVLVFTVAFFETSPIVVLIFAVVVLANYAFNFNFFGLQKKIFPKFGELPRWKKIGVNTIYLALSIWILSTAALGGSELLVGVLSSLFFILVGFSVYKLSKFIIKNKFGFGKLNRRIILAKIGDKKPTAKPHFDSKEAKISPRLSSKTRKRIALAVASIIFILIGVFIYFGYYGPSIASVKSPTNQSPVNIKVTYYPGGTIRLYFNSEVYEEKRTNNNDTVEFQEIDLVEGENQFKAVVVDDKGKEGWDSSTATIIYDITPPDKPQIAGLATEVTDKKQKLEGTTEARALVKIFLNQQLFEEVKANNDGKFSATIELKEGENSVQLQAVDEAGNSSELTDTYKIVYVDKKKLEKEAQLKAEERKKQQEQEQKREEEEKRKAEEESKRKQKREDFLTVYEIAINILEISDNANKQAIKLLESYYSFKISRATLYSNLKIAEDIHYKGWKAYGDLKGNVPESLDDYKEDLHGYEGSLTQLQISMNLRKEAMGELAKYIDTSSLESFKKYEDKINEQTSWATSGYAKLLSVANKLNIKSEELKKYE